MIGWTGYLEYTPHIAQLTQQVENSCHVKIDFNNYDSYDQMIDYLREPSKGQYDIVIASDTFEKGILDYIKNPSSDLYKTSRHYNPYVRQHMRELHYPPNVAFFQLALTGFVYNPKLVHPSKNFCIKDAFKIAEKHIVIMMDDPYETAVMVQRCYYSHEPRLPLTKKQIIRNLHRFQKEAMGKKIWFSELYNPRDNSKDFALQYIWEGDGMLIKKAVNSNTKQRLKFMIPQDYTYITSDILATLNNKPATNCVARQLTSPHYIESMDQDQYYFSPYLSEQHTLATNDAEYNRFQQLMLTDLKNARPNDWIEGNDFSDHQEVYNLWQKIRAEVNHQRYVKYDANVAS